MNGQQSVVGVVVLSAAALVAGGCAGRFAIPARSPASSRLMGLPSQRPWSHSTPIRVAASAATQMLRAGTN